MPDFDAYEVMDFVMSPRFQVWVRKENEADEQFWEEWLSERPEKQETLEEAARLVQVLDAGQRPLTENEVALQWERFQRLLAQDPMRFSQYDG